MRSISRLLGAFGTLADSLLSLASVVEVATGKLRQQLAAEEVHVIEHRPTDGATVTPVTVDQPARRNGKKTATV
jgi:hypothetical protein